jgi:quercetin dioxygenase-like cupin family protein
MSSSPLPDGALALDTLITASPHAISSRVLAKTGGGSVTLFAFDAGEGLAEHSSPYEALVVVIEGAMTITVGGTAANATRQMVVRLPATVPHALEAHEPSRVLLVMLKS